VLGELGEGWAQLVEQHPEAPTPLDNGQKYIYVSMHTQCAKHTHKYAHHSHHLHTLTHIHAYVHTHLRLPVFATPPTSTHSYVHVQMETHFSQQPSALTFAMHGDIF
jgi:hypothetical protein